MVKNFIAEVERRSDGHLSDMEPHIELVKKFDILRVLRCEVAKNQPLFVVIPGGEILDRRGVVRDDQKRSV
jgi:hypothetical protein